MVRLLLSIGFLMAALACSSADANVFNAEAGGMSIQLSAFSTTQSAGATGAPVHSAELSFRSGSALKFVELLARLMASADPVVVKVTEFTSLGAVVNVRTFSGAAITDIATQTLDAQSKEELVTKARLSAPTMSIVQGGTGSPKLGSKGSKMVASQFRFSMPELPSGNLSKISSHRLIPCASRTCDSITQFEILVRGADVATWRSWFQKASADAGYRGQASYALLTSDLSRPLLTVSLVDIRPVAFQESSDAIGPTARVTLRPKLAKVETN